MGADIGGANLKYASVDRAAHGRTFPLWLRPKELAQAITQDLRSFLPIGQLAVTMTGELADCFPNRHIGVQHIVRHCMQAAKDLAIERVVFYGLDGNFHRADQVLDPSLGETDLLAAANWHALANYVGKHVARGGLLIDVGSTTTDIVPIDGGCVAIESRTDFQRLGCGSLVYIGCRRTPVCALVDQLVFNGQSTPVMNEVFATMDDVRLLLGLQSESTDDTDTADGKGRTSEFAAGRLARMVGLDCRQVSLKQAEKLARQVHDSACRRIGKAIDLTTPVERQCVILSGHGDDLVPIPKHTKTLRLKEILGDEVARCAPAFAVAQLLHCEGATISGAS